MMGFLSGYKNADRIYIFVIVQMAKREYIEEKTETAFPEPTSDPPRQMARLSETKSVVDEQIEAMAANGLKIAPQLWEYFVENSEWQQWPEKAIFYFFAAKMETALDEYDGREIDAEFFALMGIAESHAGRFNETFQGAQELGWTPDQVVSEFYIGLARRAALQATGSILSRSQQAIKENAAAFES